VVIGRRSLLLAGAAIPVSAYGQCVTDAPEEARTNLALQSAVALPPWGAFSLVVAVPVATANNTTAPDGTTTATRLVYPAITGAGAASAWYQSIPVAAAQYAFSVWLKGAVGGEQVYLYASVATYSTSARLTLTTQWQRFTFVTSTLTATSWAFAIGADLRDTNQTSTPAQTIYAWGAQVEQGVFATSYIPTTTVSVARTVGATLMSPTQKCRW
jgi:hypothetical protein